MHKLCGYVVRMGGTRKKAAAPAPEPEPTRRRPASDIDAAISAEVNRLRAVAELTQQELGERAGKDYYHAQRMLRPSGPRQSWTVAELLDYAAALGVSATSILAAAGAITPDVSLLERIIADPDLSPSDKTTLANMVQVMHQARR